MTRRHRVAQAGPLGSGRTAAAVAALAFVARTDTARAETTGGVLQAPDPAAQHVFQLPTARPLRLGDATVETGSLLGWAGVRYGFTRGFDAGVGVPFYLAGLSLEVRGTPLLRDHYALSLWAHASIPFHPGEGSPSSFMGFTWRGGGAAWLAGPLGSIWGRQVAVHAGLLLGQRVLLLGLWAGGHVALDVRANDFIRVLAGAVVLAEGVPERADPETFSLARSQGGRVLPYATLGMRLHTRRFAVDLGVVGAFGVGTPLSLGAFSIWPDVVALYQF